MAVRASQLVQIPIKHPSIVTIPSQLRTCFRRRTGLRLLTEALPSCRIGVAFPEIARELFSPFGGEKSVLPTVWDMFWNKDRSLFVDGNLAFMQDRRCFSRDCEGSFFSFRRKQSVLSTVWLLFRIKACPCAGHLKERKHGPFGAKPSML